MRRTGMLLLVLLAVSLLLLVRNVYGSSMPTSAATAYIPAPVVASDSFVVADHNPAPEGSPAPAGDIPDPEPAIEVISSAAGENPTLDDNTVSTSEPPDPASMPEAISSTAEDNPVPQTALALIVAAHDSLNTNEADFVCDGLNDQLEIQAAIDELEALGGGRVVFRKGNYHLSPEGNYCLYLPGDLALEGEAGASAADVRFMLVGEPDRGVFETKGWSYNPPFVKVSNIRFSNITIDVGRPKGFTNEWPEGVYWQDFLVIAGSIDNLLLENVNFVTGNPESVRSRLYLHQCGKVQIFDCDFEGVAVWATSLQAQLGQPTVILGQLLAMRNTWRNTAATMALGGEMYGFTATDNVFYNCYGTAIDCCFSPHAVIERNEIHGATGVGIYSEGGHSVTIRNNSIDGVVYRNPDTEFGGFGIATADYRHYRLGENILIEGNTITDCGNGIQALGTRDVTIQNNNITGLEATGITVALLASGEFSYDGIPSLADNCTVRDNTISDFGRSYSWSRGILLHNVEGTQVIDNFIDGNNNAGAALGIEEFFSQLCQCPVCGWIFSHDWETGLDCSERSCPECGASLEAYELQSRPDNNFIINNTINGVPRQIRTIGLNTVVQSNSVQ